MAPALFTHLKPSIFEKRFRPWRGSYEIGASGEARGADVILHRNLTATVAVVVLVVIIGLVLGVDANDAPQR